MNPHPLLSRAFSLIEVTLALGIFATCILTVLALLPIGTGAQRDAVGKSIAVEILSEVVSDLRMTPKTINTSAQFRITFGTPSTLYFDGNGAATDSPDEQTYRLTINFPPNDAGSFSATLVDLKITWPATVDPASTAGVVETLGAFDRHL